MRIGVLSTFPPRQCGIATFSADLIAGLRDAPGVDAVEVIAVTNGDEFTYPPPVVATISQEVRADYGRAARLVGRLGLDVVMIEHEFGIFGGRDGEFLLSFTDELAVPYVVTLHTVLSSPSPNQDAVLRELCRRAAAVLVFTDTARRMVTTAGIADPDRVHVVPHGAPPEITRLAESAGTHRVIPLEGVPGVGPSDTRDRFVITSFGLISPGKGIETTIEALATLVDRHPDVLLVVAGRTHPEVARRHGEEYRLTLESLVRRHGLERHVSFDDRFLSIDELADLLAATDLFVTAYRSPEQIVSGALTFALAAGCPVVSTPYRYAQDLLASGAGRLVPFDDAEALADSIAELIEHPERLAAMRAEARQVGRALSWPAVGRSTAEILRLAVAGGTPHEAALVHEWALPPLRLDHLRTLLDDVGIIQHATGCVPNLSTGYCVDDVARLVQVASQLATRTHDRSWARVVRRGLAFLIDAAAEGGMHNFMSYDRRWLDHPHHGDHVGRTIWALGDLLASDIPPTLAAPAVGLLDRLCDDAVAHPPSSPRTVAYTLLGLSRLPDHLLPADRLAVVDRLATWLAGLHGQYSAPGWNWFEPYLAYDNARLPQALIVAGRRLGRRELVELGLDTLRWYGDQCGLGDRLLVLPGNGGRARHLPHPGEGDEQPLDAAALVEAEIDALRATGDPNHARRAADAFGWFTGHNRLRRSVYDPTTGGCGDGLGAEEVSLNQGAESTLAYFTARLALESAGMPVLARHALHAT